MHPARINPSIVEIEQGAHRDCIVNRFIGPAHIVQRPHIIRRDFWRRTIHFVDKVNRSSPEITADDMRPLYDVGWADEAIYYAITVCALFNFYNRWVDASGVHEIGRASCRERG